jgi:hypothetical protein
MNRELQSVNPERVENCYETQVIQVVISEEQA